MNREKEVLIDSKKNVGFVQAIKTFPVCNHTSHVGTDNLGYMQGIFQDGTPFEAELWSCGEDLNLSFVFPILEDIAVSDDCLTSDNILGFHNADVRKNCGVLTIGMVDNGTIDDVDTTITYVDYLKNQGVVEFTTDMENGAVMLLTDIQGNELVHVIITLKEGDKILGDTSLIFYDFPNSIHKHNMWVVK